MYPTNIVKLTDQTIDDNARFFNNRDEVPKTAISMGIGTIIIGLASVIIGEVILGVDSFSASLAAVILGSVIYRVVIAVVLYMGMPPNDLKLFTAIIVVLALAAPMIKGKVNVGK